MRAITIEPGVEIAELDLRNTVVTQDVRIGDTRLRKGHRLSEGDAALLTALDRPVHAIVLDAGDIHEDDAGARLAAAVAGPGVDIQGPKFSRYNLIARSKGLLRVDADTLLALNRLPGIAVFTLADRSPVVPGQITAGIKVTPVAIADDVLREAEAIAAAAGPIVQVAPFQPLQVAVIITEQPDWKAREAFQSAVTKKIGWYGGAVMGFSDLEPEAGVIAAEITRLADQGADLVLAAGGSTIDPLDPTLLALREAGAEMVRYGAPADPGSMFWLAYRGEMPIFNLASCSMFSRSTVADIVLPWIMTGERVEPETLAALGHGGLLERDMTHRFPAYDTDRIDQSDAE